MDTTMSEHTQDINDVKPRVKTVEDNAAGNNVVTQTPDPHASPSATDKYFASIQKIES